MTKISGVEFIEQDEHVVTWICI